MRALTLSLTLATAVLALCLQVGTAQAQATRTWISGVGDDANPCSRTAPCKTWAGAISKTMVGGEIDALDPGGFGGVTITKAITFDGGGGQVASVLVAGTPGITVAAGVNDVVILRNLRLNGIQQAGSGSTNGVSFSSGAALIVENCDIFGFGTWGISSTSSGSSALYVLNTVVANNGSGTTGGAVLIQAGSGGTTKASLTGVKAVNNAVGIKVSGDNSANKTLVTIDNSQSFGSPHSGLAAETGGGSGNGAVTIMVDNVDSSNNNVGFQANGTNTLVLLGSSTATGNGTGVLAQSSGQVLSYKNNQINGNTTDGTPVPAVSGTGGLN
jgi:hypothetical protein